MVLKKLPKLKNRRITKRNRISKNLGITKGTSTYKIVINQKETREQKKQLK